MDDSGNIQLARKVEDLAIDNNGDGKNRLITSELKTLLTYMDADPNREVFSKGGNLFRNMLQSSTEEDLRSGYPLEFAFVWTIATRSAVTKGRKRFWPFGFGLFS
jgi:hypothetical protein